LLSLWISNLLGEASLKLRVAAAAALLLPVVAAVTGRLKELLLIAWVGSLTYNRQYFSFEALTGNLGTQGPYWIVSDIFLAGLLLEWLYQTVVRKRPAAPPQGPSFSPWYLPLAGMGLISLLVAPHPDWTMYEMIRSVKFCLILWYVRRQFGKREWWIAVVAMGVAMVGQSVIGLKEVITGHSGLLGADVSTSVGGYENVFDQETFYGGVRATGTMNHPPNLACYLILLIPLFLGLSLTLRSARLRLGAALFCVMGCVGLVCNQSRWPALLLVGELAVVLCGLVVLKEISWRSAAGLTFLSILVAMLAAFPLRNKIIDRFTQDFSASIDQRAEGNRVAFAMIEESPWLGVGLNNSKDHLVKYVPDLAWALENEDFLTREMHSRSIAAMGNGFLFVTVELGVIGTLAYAVYLFGNLLVSFRSVLRTEGAVRGACLGLTMGTIGVLLEQFIDFSIWVDPQFYTSALVVAMLTMAPTLFPPDNTASAPQIANADLRQVHA
jgi:O-Antigen ligase